MSTPAPRPVRLVSSPTGALLIAHTESGPRVYRVEVGPSGATLAPVERLPAKQARAEAPPQSWNDAAEQANARAEIARDIATEPA